MFTSSYNSYMFKRPKGALLLTAASVMALAQGSFDPARTYVVGEKDVYAMNVKMTTASYDASITGKLSFKTKKVWDNGDADLETQATDVEVNLLGNVDKKPASDIRVTRYTKFGVPIEPKVEKGDAGPKYMNFLTFRPSTVMQMGQTVKIDEQLNDATKTHVTGTSKLEALADGVAKVVSSLDVTQGKGKKPMHIDSIGYIDVKTAKMNRVESKLVNIDGEGDAGAILAITVVIERQK